MKRLLSLFLALVLLAAFAIPAFADEEPADDLETFPAAEGELETLDGETVTDDATEEDVYIWDEADILTDSEREKLNELCRKLTEEHEFGVYIMTVNDYSEYGHGDVYDVSTQIFLEKGLGVGDDADGIFLILSMDERDFAFCAHGYGEKAITAYTRGILEQAFLDNFRNNDWYGGFRDYAETSVEIIEDTRAGKYDKHDYYDDYYNYYNYDGSKKSLLSGTQIAVIVIVPLIIAGIAILIMSSKHRSVKKAVTAEDYVIPMSLNIYNSQDIYTHTTESRRYISDDSRSGGGGGGGGGSSFHSGGGFSGSSGKF